MNEKKYQRIATPEIDVTRLDADFYKTEFVENHRLLHKGLFVVETLSKIAERIACGPFGSDLPSSLYREKGIPLYRVQNVRDGVISEEGLVYLDKEFSDSMRSCRFNSGDVLIAKSGLLGRVAYVPSSVSICNVTQDVIGLAIDKTKIDAHFLTAFLSSDVGRVQIVRWGQGNVQQHLNMPSVREFVYIKIDQKAQAYIGEKVRQAERLREQARGIREELENYFANEKPYISEGVAISKVPFVELTEILTANSYKHEFLENRRKLAQTHKRLVPFTSFFETIRNGFDERDSQTDGIPYLKVADVAPNYPLVETAGRVSEEVWNDASIAQRPAIGDLLLTRKGTFGIAASVTIKARFLASSEVFVCKPKNKKVLPIVSWFLNSYAGRCQFLQWATGTTMPGINQENLARVLVPVFDDELMNHFEKLNTLYVQSQDYSFSLIQAAKLLVEALIEGKISEAELKQAQEALERGDNSLDRAILSRLMRKGIDAAKEPLLFADLDALYDAIAQTSTTDEGKEK